MSFLEPESIKVDRFGVWFVLLMCVIPIAAIRSARKARPVGESHHPISKRLKNVLLLCVIAAFAPVVAWRDNIQLFPPIQITGRLAALSAAVLIGTLALAEPLLMARSPQERRQLWVRQIIPGTNAERGVWVVSSIVAGMTEEIIFRGVLFALLLTLTRSTAIAALVSAVIFNMVRGLRASYAMQRETR